MHSFEMFRLIGCVLMVVFFLSQFRIVTEAARTGDKAKRKCEEYAKFVYHDEHNPTLHVTATKGMQSVSKCGIEAVPLIIGGIKAGENEFPHMAVIGYGSAPADMVWQCGGSLISDSYVLTAAHCLHHREKGDSQRVRVGTNNVANPDATMQEADVAKRIGHPDYKARAKYNDIALLQLAKPLELNAHVRPACLCTEIHFDWTLAIATGFGRLEYEKTATSNELMKVQLSNIKKSACAETYKTMRAMHDGVIESQFCAGEMAGKKDTCQGDSGGPLQLIMDKPYCMYKLVGITSFGKFCGFENSPGIYTRVASYIDWIESQVWT